MPVKCIASPPEGHRDDVVTVEDQSISDLFLLFGMFQGLGHQSNRVGLGKEMGDNETIVQVLDGRQICPALQGADISYIGNPLLVGLGSGKLTVEHIRIAVVGTDFLQLFVQFGLSRLRTEVEFGHQP